MHTFIQALSFLNRDLIPNDREQMTANKARDFKQCEDAKERPEETKSALIKSVYQTISFKFYFMIC